MSFSWNHGERPYGRAKAPVYASFMAQLPDAIAREVEGWIASRRAVKVAENLLRDDPDNRSLQERLKQATAQAKDSAAVLRAALAAHGYSLEDLQRLCAGAG